MLKIILPDPESIKSALVNAGVIASRDNIGIEYISQRYPRKRTARRGVCRVWQDERCTFQFYIGDNVSDLYARAKAFSDACSAISVRPAFNIPADETGRGIVGFPFYEGLVAEEAFASGRITAADLESAVQTLHRALAHTERPSRLQDAERELAELLDSLAGIEEFSDLDIAFLGEAVFPDLRSKLIDAAKPVTRWSNGDFTTSNIVLGSDGPKLLDYEFAARTHFFREDTVRLCRYSNVPVSLHELARRFLGNRYETVVIYGLLRQIALEAQVKAIEEFREELGPLVQDLLILVDPLGSRFRRSLILGRTGSLADNTRGTGKAQIFFSPNAEFRPEHSVTIPVTLSENWHRYDLPLPVGKGVWRFRVDPFDAPAVVDIASLEVRQLGSDEPVFAAHDAEALACIEVAGTAVSVQSDSPFRVVAHGLDPQLLLPEIILPVDRPVTLILWLRVQPLVKALPEVLQNVQSARTGNGKMSQAEQEITSELERRCRTAEDSLAETKDAMQQDHDIRREIEAALAQKTREVEDLATELRAAVQRERSQDERCSALVSELEKSRAERSQMATTLAKITDQFNGIAEQRDGLQVELIVQRNKAQAQALVMAELESLRAQSASRAEQLDQLTKDKAELTRAVQANQNRVRELEASISWTITAPLRFLAGLFMRK